MTDRKCIHGYPPGICRACLDDDLWKRSRIEQAHTRKRIDAMGGHLELMRKVREATDRDTACSVCGATFSDAVALQRHDYARHAPARYPELQAGRAWPPPDETDRERAYRLDREEYRRRFSHLFRRESDDLSR